MTAIAGGILILLALLDMLTTVLTTRGGGPLSTRIGAASWWCARRVAYRAGRKILTIAGPSIAIGTVIMWIALLWAGWLLIFMSAHSNVVDATTGAPADFWARLYFTGYTLFTLGLGDYRPSGAGWQVLTTLAVGNGFLVISLGASYLIPVVSAATSTRSVALYINSLGSSPKDILNNAWDGEGFSSLTQHLATLTPMIIQSGQQHLAYPVLHYFQSVHRASALPLQLAVLQDTVLILQAGLPSDVRLPAAATRPLLQAISAFACTIGSEPSSEEPPAPDLSLLSTPKIEAAEFASALRTHSDDRRRAATMVEKINWEWDAVSSPDTA